MRKIVGWVARSKTQQTQQTDGEATPTFWLVSEAELQPNLPQKICTLQSALDEFTSSFQTSRSH